VLHAPGRIEPTMNKNLATFRQPVGTSHGALGGQCYVYSGCVSPGTRTPCTSQQRISTKFSMPSHVLSDAEAEPDEIELLPLALQRHGHHH
jgi:hypothetical protein